MHNTVIPYRLLMVLLLIAALPACNKLLEVPPPPNELGVNEVFNDSTTAVSAIQGIYSGMVTHGYFEYGGLSYFAARSADEVVTSWDVGNFEKDSLSYTDNDIGNIWSQAFGSLLTINTCIDGLTKTTALAAHLRQRLLGEALFCRAFVYFYLVNTWGNAVPLITSADVARNYASPSVPQQQVYEQIMADLQEAQRLLKQLYTGTYRVRPNAAATAALLARVYLYRGRFNDAIAQSSQIIGSNLYQLSPAPDNVFLKTSEETIWQLAPANEEVADFAIYSDGGINPTPQLQAAFEPGDRRQEVWIQYDSTWAPTFIDTLVYKYRGQPAGVTEPAEYYVILRLAEQYLIRAEAYLQLGNMAAAVADLNVIRTRAGLPDLPVTLTGQQCMLAVEQERRVELFTEWGHRWFDLKRWPGINNPSITRADEVLGNSKPDWQPRDSWYPVPQSELRTNTNLVQNPGYPSW